jgi:hypothetical protein
LCAYFNFTHTHTHIHTHTHTFIFIFIFHLVYRQLKLLVITHINRMATEFLSPSYERAYDAHLSASFLNSTRLLDPSSSSLSPNPQSISPTYLSLTSSLSNTSTNVNVTTSTLCDNFRCPEIGPDVVAQIFACAIPLMASLLVRDKQTHTHTHTHHST